MHVAHQSISILSALHKANSLAQRVGADQIERIINLFKSWSDKEGRFKSSSISSRRSILATGLVYTTLADARSLEVTLSPESESIVEEIRASLAQVGVACYTAVLIKHAEGLHAVAHINFLLNQFYFTAVNICSTATACTSIVMQPLQFATLQALRLCRTHCIGILSCTCANDRCSACVCLFRVRLQRMYAYVPSYFTVSYCPSKNAQSFGITGAHAHR